MEPVSIVGLAAAIQQLVTAIYQVGQGVREAKREMNQLCSELLALKAALEHVQLNLGQQNDTGVGSEDPQSMLSSSNLNTPDFKNMLASTNAILQDLLARLHPNSSRFKSSLQRISWVLMKEDIKRDTQRLERSKTWFILATTSESA
jgi:hypothetical protein